jgi:hypothetical protein
LHYKEHFRGKIIFCNCDDPYESHFFKYFAINFNHLGLKKLIATCYAGSPIANKQLSLFDEESEENKTTKSPHKLEITEVSDENKDGSADLADVALLLKNGKNNLERLKGDGDFRSAECIEILKEADIVVTNPPFSLFREYVTQLIEYNKKFLVVGNMNALTYKEIFPLIKENKLWLGSDNGGTKWFQVPPHYDIKTETRIKVENGIKYFSMGSIMWFTNLDHKKRHEEIILFRKYTQADYPKYDNYDAIEVSTYRDIPADHFGLMGVPISFLDKYNPSQFEIIGLANDKRDDNLAFIKGTPTYLDEGHKSFVGMVLNKKATYARIIIKRRHNDN